MIPNLKPILADITTMLDDPTGYGRVITDADGQVQEIVEQKVASPEQEAIKQINSGIYCFAASSLWKHLAEIKANPISNEFEVCHNLDQYLEIGFRISDSISNLKSKIVLSGG